MHKVNKTLLLKILVLGLGIGLLVIALAGLVRPAAAATPPLRQPAMPVNLALDNATCLSCHNQPGLTKTLPNGEVLSLTIDQSHYSSSVHKGLNCTDCHQNMTTIPHAAMNVKSLRDITLQLYVVCQKCHADQYGKTLDSVHQKALVGGNIK